MSDLKDETLRRAQELADFKLLSSGDIPKIDLYMEQVTSLLEQEMGPSLRRKDESVFTNTMINNYSKEGVLPRPENKRYNRRHIITLIYIFLLKQNLPMPEINVSPPILKIPSSSTTCTAYFMTLLAAMKRPTGRISKRNFPESSTSARTRV